MGGSHPTMRLRRDGARHLFHARECELLGPHIPSHSWEALRDLSVRHPVRVLFFSCYHPATQCEKQKRSRRHRRAALALPYLL